MSWENPRPFNERLRAFRDSKGLSRSDLASELGVSSITLYRWETGSTKPSPLAAERLGSLGFGQVAPSETSVSTVPRLQSGKRKARATAADELRAEGNLSLGPEEAPVHVLASPFVRNGPLDQAGFHRRLLDLQFTSLLPSSILHPRLSMVEHVDGVGPTSQHLLERPRPVAVSWNSNYGPHGWHRYVGRFPAHVVRSLLNHFGAGKHSVVCDPFLGSGTTAVECRLLGIPFVGIEICPLSVMISRTKAAFPAEPTLLAELSHRLKSFFDAKWHRFVGDSEPRAYSHSDVLGREGNQIPAFANLERWFTPEALLGVSIAVEFGMAQRDFAREAVLTALSSKMRSIGNVDVDVVRAEYSKHPRENVAVGKLVCRQLMKMAADVAASLSSHRELIGPASGVTIHEGSVLDVELEAGSIDCVITSPPYGVEAISYLRTHLLSYRSLASHLGHDPYDTRDKTIGSEYLEGSDETAGLRARERSVSCRRFFEAAASSVDAKYLQRRAAMMQFCDDMLAVGERMSRWLRRDGNVAFVIGNKRLGVEVIPMDTIVTELFASCGLVPIDAIRHKLKTNNSNSQVPWQERVIQEESILFFRKAES